MWKNLFQSFSKGVRAFRFNATSIRTPTNSVSRLFNRRRATNQLIHRWNHLKPHKVSIDKARMLPLKSPTSTDAEYQMGFARKPGLPIPNFPISHSAICFYHHPQEKYIVVGRQSPFALNIRNWNLSTRVDNEADYLANDYHFDAIMTNAKFSEQEILQMIQEANQNINEAQLCDMHHSNCYSNAIYMMASALERMVERNVPPSEDEVRSVMNIISIAAQDHLSIGVLNNEIVSEKMANAFAKAKKFCSKDESCIDNCIEHLLNEARS